MTNLQYEHLKAGDIVTMVQGPNKDKILKVVRKLDGIPGLFEPRLEAKVFNNDDVLLVGKKKEPSKTTFGCFRCFKLVYAPKDLAELQRRHVLDPTRKLTPAWEYFVEAYEKSKKNFRMITAWNKIRLLTCQVYGVNVVKDIPDEKVPEAIECAKSFIDHFIEWNAKEGTS